jgi:K+-sensing histidine kinase KdpD
MNAIVGFSYIIEQKDSKQTPESGLSAKILSTCNQLIWLIDNFLNSSLIEIGESDVRLTKCNLKDFCSQLNKELNDILIQAGANKIMLETDDTYPDDQEVMLDVQKLTQIIKALFINAVNSMDNGHIRLGYYYNGIELKFYIADSGQDYEKCREFLNSGNLDYSMSKFYDASSAINIILSKKLVNLMGGTLHISHNNQTGTGYLISIPGFSCNSKKLFKSRNEVFDTCTISNIHS